MKMLKNQVLSLKNYFVKFFNSFNEILVIFLFFLASFITFWVFLFGVLAIISPFLIINLILHIPTTTIFHLLDTPIFKELFYISYSCGFACFYYWDIFKIFLFSILFRNFYLTTSHSNLLIFFSFSSKFIPIR